MGEGRGYDSVDPARIVSEIPIRVTAALRMKTPGLVVLADLLLRRYPTQAGWIQSGVYLTRQAPTTGISPNLDLCMRSGLTDGGFGGE